MKHTRKHKLHLPLAFLLSLILIFEGMSVVAFAADSDDTTVGTEVDTGMLVPEPSDAEDEIIESDVIISPPSVSVEDREQVSTTATTTQAIPDGIYALRNAGNAGLYMDTQYDASSPGYKLQQYAYSQSPVKTLSEGGFANGGVFKVSYRSDLGTYVIRSMTNNLLSYKFSGNYVVTHEIPAEDAQVAAADTFTITRGGNGYFITPYGQNYCIAANATTASGAAGAPDSYLIKSTQAASGKQAQWLFAYYSYYTTEHKQGYLMQQEPTAEDLVAGNTCTFKVKTWSTKINHNVPYLRLAAANGSDYTFNWQTNTLSVSLHEDGRITLWIEAREDDMTRNLIATRSYNVTLPFEPGIYYFKNRQMGKYMQIDDVGSATMEVLPFEGMDNQKWVIEHVRKQYYTIKSAENGLYLTVPEGSHDSNYVKLRLQESTSTRGQLWCFEKPHAGIDSYVIRPDSGEGKTTDWCINVKDTLLGWDDGAIVQGDFQDNTSYLDEWVLELADPFRITFYGVTNVNHDHATSLETIEENLRDAGFNNINLYEGSMMPLDCLDHLMETNVFTIRSHGEPLFNAETGELECTGIILNDLKEAARIGLYSHPSDQMTINSSYIVSGDSFENVKLAVFMGCETGYGGENGKNLPAVVVSQGAEVAIGFEKKIDCNNANIWIEKFYAALLSGKTVSQAVNVASSTEGENSALSSDYIIICGNENYKLSE